LTTSILFPDAENPGVTPMPQSTAPGTITSVFSAADKAFEQLLKAQRRDSGTLDIKDGLVTAIHDIQYTRPTPTEMQPVSIGEISYTNDGTVEQTVTWSKEEKTTATSSVTVTRGLEAGASLDLKIPQIDLGLGVSVKATLSTAVEQSLSVEQTWKWEQPLRVPSNTVVTAQAMLSRAKFDVEFTAKVRIDGPADSVTVRAPGDPAFVFIGTLGEFFTVSPVEGVTPDGTGVLFEVKGVMNNIEGIGINVVVHERPLQAPTRSYTVQDVNTRASVTTLLDADRRGA
jgi:hypothetical protein